MPIAAENTKPPDLRRTLTCAALSTLTSLGVFSLVANLMTPMFAGLRYVSSQRSAQTSQSLNFEDTACVQAAHADDTQESKPAAI